jgi:triacylglycerol lipase
MSATEDLARVDPDLRAIVGLLPDLSDLSDATLPAIRTAVAGATPVMGRDESGVAVSRIEIPGLRGAAPISALLYEPPTQDAPRPALLDLHGGGYVSGTAQRDDAMLRLIAKTLGIVGLAPDYRLAPEAPYPAALDDSAASLAWLHANASALRIDPARIGVRGVSAGGGLAAGLALRTRDERGPAISHLHLLFPMLDDRTGEHAYNGRYVWTASANRYGWAALLRGHDRAAPSPYAVPARAGELSKLPPTFIALGALDLFAAENLDFGRRLIDAGVALEMHVYPGAYHAFPLVAAARCSKALVRDEIEALRRALCE